MGAIEHPPIVTLPAFFPFSLLWSGSIPDHVTYTWLVMLILIGLSASARSQLSLVPRGAQNFLEVVLEQFITMIDDVIGPQGRRYLPLIATLGLYILVGNLIGLVPGMSGPTTNLNTTASCAIVVFVAYHWIGIRQQGVLTYLNHFSGPMPWSPGMVPIKLLMIPIEIVSHLARPLSLTLRLFGNMAGGHILLAVIFLLMGLDGLIGWALSGSLGGIVIGGIGGAVVIAFTVGFLYPLKILVSLLQAFIFVMLTMLYISLAVEEAEHHAGHAAAHH